VAGISSRHGKVGIAIQPVKGTPAAAPTKVYYLAGTSSLGPTKTIARFPMTDSGRDQGLHFTSLHNVAGDLPLWLHPDGAAQLLYAVMGTNADSGAGPNYTHTITPGADVPWLTVWRNVGNSGVIERFTDCKMTSLSGSFVAGQGLMVTASLIGISYEYLSSDFAGTALSTQPYIYPEFLGALVGAGSARQIHSFDWGVDNGTIPYQADGYGYVEIDPGGRTVTLTFGVRFQGATAYPNYRTFFYGSDTGTTMTPTVGTSTFVATASRDANTSVAWNFPQIVYTPFSPQPDPGGAPIEMDVACEVERPSGGNILTVTVKDQVATVT
jgi:hypothetical protein